MPPLPSSPIHDPAPAERLPRVADGTIYEVQPMGDNTVYRVDHRRMLEWANETAERQLKRKAE
jgi:hypothetical protein